MNKTSRLLFIIGSALVLISLLLHRTGIYPANLSPRRTLFLSLGLISIFSAVGYLYFENKVTRILKKLEQAIVHHPITHWWEKKQFIESDQSNKFKYVNRITILWSLIIFCVYLWFVSAGHWTSLPYTTGYNDQLANAFTKGHTYLDTTPNPQEKIPKPIDYSLYKGKYYLYFGPAPALFLATYKILFAKTVGDQYLVFMFITGSYIFQCLLIIGIWKQYFWNLPAWTTLIPIPLIGFGSPSIYMLVTARIYESAIAAGQFFLIGGLYFIYKSFERSQFSLIKLGLAALFFGFSVGSRITLSLPIGYVSVMVVWWVIKLAFDTNKSSRLKYLLTFFNPICVCIILLCVYNFVRFDMIRETGFRYTSMGFRLVENNIQPFNLAYSLQNLYNYFLNPPRLLQGFPFLSAISLNKTSISPYIKLPIFYTGEQITGVLVSSPFVLFSIIVIWFLFNKIKPASFLLIKSVDFTTWFSLVLIGCVILSLGPLLLFFWATMRYTMDFIPSLLLLAVIGFWQGYSLLSSNVQRILYSWVAVSLAGTSILMSFLLGFSINLWWIDYFHKT